MHDVHGAWKHVVSEEERAAYLARGPAPPHVDASHLRLAWVASRLLLLGLMLVVLLVVHARLSPPTDGAGILHNLVVTLWGGDGKGRTGMLTKLQAGGGAVTAGGDAGGAGGAGGAAGMSSADQGSFGNFSQPQDQQQQEL